MSPPPGPGRTGRAVRDIAALQAGGQQIFFVNCPIFGADNSDWGAATLVLQSVRRMNCCTDLVNILDNVLYDTEEEHFNILFSN